MEISNNEHIDPKLSKSLKVLIADDDEMSASYLEILVSPFSNEVLVANNGLKAIELCFENSDIDLILMDMKMPIIDGYEAVRKIREFNKNVVIIAQTAYGFIADRQKAFDAGTNDYLPKPIYRKELLEILKKYFGVN